MRKYKTLLHVCINICIHGLLVWFLQFSAEHLFMSSPLAAA
jgi:hypothetical protein